MYLLGILALFQIAILPGIIVLNFLSIKRNVIRTMIFSFGISLVFNYVLVLILTTLKIYIFPVIIVVFVIEFILLLIILIKPNIFLKGKKQKYIYAINIIAIVSMVIVILLAWLANQFYINKNIMIGADAIFSWNTWAVEWAKNILPTNVRHYPQLLPANWSLTYLFIRNTNVEFFAKTMMLFFPFYMVLIGVEIFVSTKKIKYLLGTIFLVLIMKLIWTVWPTFSMGLADIPVAFIGFLSVYSLLTAKNANSKKETNIFLLLGAIFAVASTLIKQSGIYITVFYPILVWIILFNKNSKYSKKEKLQFIFTYIGLIIILIAPWYIYVKTSMVRGIESADRAEKIFSKGGIFYNKSFGERIIPAYECLKGYFKNATMLVIAFILSMFSLKDKNLRWILILVVIPYTLLWSIFWGYDIRNWSIAIPMFGFLIGVGLTYLIKMIPNKFKILQISIRKESIDFVQSLRKNTLKKISTSKIISFAIITSFLIITISGSFYFTNEYILNKQKESVKHKVGDFPYLNTLLYNHLEKSGDKGNIISNYKFAQCFPEIDVTINALSDFETFKQYIKQNNPKYIFAVTGMYWGGYISPDVQTWIGKKLKTKKYSLVFTNKNGYLIKIKEDK